MKTYSLTLGRPGPVQQYADAYYELVDTFFNNWQDEEVEDLMQETLIAFQNMPKEVRKFAEKSLVGMLENIKLCNIDQAKVN